MFRFGVGGTITTKQNETKTDGATTVVESLLPSCPLEARERCARRARLRHAAADSSRPLYDGGAG